jgi:hypothetical protein
MAALPCPLLPSSSGSILVRIRSSSSVVAFSICVLVSILATLLSCVLQSHNMQEYSTQDKAGIVGNLLLDYILILALREE